MLYDFDELINSIKSPNAITKDAALPLILYISITETKGGSSWTITSYLYLQTALTEAIERQEKTPV